MYIRSMSSLFLLVIMTGRLRLQPPMELGWSQPINLSNSQGSSTSPLIESDGFGRFHVFWIEDLDGEAHVLGQAARPGNAIMYRLFQASGGWTSEVDIFYAGEKSRIDRVDSVIDSGGIVHLAWIQNSTLLYSRSHVDGAGNAQAWLDPIQLERGRVIDVKLEETRDGIIVIYSAIFDDIAGVYSSNTGLHTPQMSNVIWETSGESKAVPQFVSAAVDQSDQVHVIWEVDNPEERYVDELRYSRASDGGKSWLVSRVVAKASTELDSLMMARPWVAVGEQNEVHLQWAQGRITYRWHQYSSDGGSSWQPPYQIWPDLVSQTSSQAVGVDGDGNLLWADQLRYPGGAYLTEWNGNEWEPPALFYLMQTDSKDPLGDRLNVHRIRMAIALGNVLGVVFTDATRAEIWYMETLLESNFVAPMGVTDGEDKDIEVALSTGRSTDQVPENLADPQSVSKFVLDAGTKDTQYGDLILSAAAPVIALVLFVLIAERRRLQ